MKRECQKSAGMLFSGEIEGLCDDDFEGSTTELHTSRNVYFGNDGGRGSKRCLVTGAINFERDYSKDADVSLGSNSGKSAITSQEDSRGKSAPVNLSDGFYKAPRNEPGGSVKRMKLSVDEKQNSLKNSHTVTCRLVESSNQGFSCSCYLLKKHIEMIQTGDKDNSSSRLFRLDGSEQKEIGPSKAIASPVSQESSATKLPRWKDSCVVELDEADMSLSRESANDPRPLLRYHINRLLKAAGWVIGRRKRSSHYNGVGEYVYMSPDGRSIRVFHRAWIMCGQNLFTDSNNALWGSEDLIQWDDLTQFMFDLSNTSTEIGKLNNLESSAALAHYWYLLDPFANVVFIDKSFSSLRAGKVVKAKRSILKGDYDESLENAENAGRHLADSHLTAMPSGSSLVSNSVLTVSNGDSFDSKKYTHATYDNKHPDGLKFENSTDEGGLPLNCESLGPDIKSEKPQTQGNGQKKSSKCQLDDDDLLISAIIKTKNFKSATKQSSAKRTSHKSKPLRKHQKSEKGSCRLLPRSSNKGGTHIVEGKWSTLGSRTVLSWLISSGVVSLSEVIQYRNTKDDTVVKDGLVTWDGILCRCCDTVLSVSAFKSHAGFRLAHPCMNLFMESGKPFTLCQLEAWSAEYKARKSANRTVEVDEMDQNDDSCGLCGGGGELICCDNCPSTFHQGCLYAKELPEGDWYCSHCTCQICGDVVNDNEASKSPGALKCSQCEHKYHETCLKKEKGLKADVASDVWFCGESCQDVYSGLHSRVGLTNLIADGFSWTLLRCIHGDQKVHSVQRLVALKAECNIKIAVALTIMEECFLPMVDARTGIDMIPHVLYNWGSQFARLNYHGFYTIVLEKNDVLLSVASIRIHGTTVAEMPLIATCSNYRRQGMCRYLMNAIEEILTTLKVEKLVISAIPSLVETWTMGFGFEPLEENERQSLNTINLMVFPGTVWLKKSFAYNEVAAEQRMGSFHVSPSGTDDLAEAEAFPEGGHMIEPEGNVCTLELDGGTEIKRTYDMEIQVEEDEYEEDLDKQFSKLSEEEIASLRGDQLEEICPVETVEVYSDRKIPLTEQLEKSTVMQTNDK